MTKPLSIGVVCYPSLGGSGVIGAELAVGLAERGHQVHVIASAPPSRALPDSDRLFFHELSIPEHPVFPHPPYELAVASAIVELAADHPLDVVHVHYAVPHASSAYLARQVLAGSPRGAPVFVTTLHGTDVTRFGRDPSLRAIVRFSVEGLDAVTVPSTFLEHEARRLLQLDPTRPIAVIPNFVDTDHFTPAEVRDPTRFDALFGADASGEAERGPILFHVSNFRAVKRVHDLLDTLVHVRAARPARLVLVGDGPERAALAQRARELGLGRHVCFLGKRADFVEHLRHADAFLLTSESESFGVAALEALSAGVPVAAYRVGGLPEVVPEDVGRLVEPFDTRALARAVLDLVSSPERRGELGRQARRHAVAGFRRSTAVERYEALFHRLIARAE